jgi:TrmH family RNA methyltransferase
MLEFVIVLVEPEHPHNVGFVARAMCANGLTDLRIVYQKHNSVLADSYRTAHASQSILDHAKITKNLKEAIQDVQYTIAFSRRTFESVVPVISLPSIQTILPKEGKVALVFGRESIGLLLEEINQCAQICEIPVPGNHSLNLGQAVSVALYELLKENKSGLLNDHSNSLANKAQIESFISFLEENLTERYKKQHWFQGGIRLLLQRLQPSENELGGLFGVARSLARSPARKEK